jgi:PD-(D/E)XK nuclease superfamily
VSSRGEFERVGYDLDEALPTFREAVGVIAAGITNGNFPARPGEASDFPTFNWENCRRCDFQSICPSNRAEQWLQVREAPVLADYVRLAEGVEHDAAAGDGAGEEAGS